MTKIEEIIGPMIISSKIFDYATSFFIKKELTLRYGELDALQYFVYYVFVDENRNRVQRAP